MTSTAKLLAHEAKDGRHLNVIQALLWAIFFLPFYLFGGLRLVLSPDTVPQSWMPILVPILMWVLYVSFFFFTNGFLYVLISLIVIISGIGGLIWGHKGRLAQICALLGALSVIALPWLFPYELTLHPAPGVTMQVVTQPRTPVASFVKKAYVFSDGTPCEYELLGWNTDNQLHYRSQCGAREDIWFVHPDWADEPVPMNGLSNDIGLKPGQIRQEVEAAEVLQLVHTGRDRSESAERSARYLREGSLRSPDGQWIAAITQHVYGPQDVVLIRAQ